MRETWNSTLGWMIAVGITLGIACLVLFVGLDGWRDFKREGPRVPDVQPAAHHLKLHQWYRPAKDLAWSWREMQWLPGPGHGSIPRGTPLFVVERRGHIAVMRGAVSDHTVLVPDGAGGTWFVPAGDPMGELVDPMPDKNGIKFAF